MRIELDSFKGRERSFSHPYASGEPELDDDRVRLTSKPQISGRIARQGRRVLLRGRLSAQAVVDCDRCLQPVNYPIAAAFKLQFVTTADYELETAGELDEADLTLSIFDGDGIDLDEVVREQVLLAIPDRVLCREDCKGLCPVCGKNRNLKECECQAGEIDPRWAGLNELVNRKL